MPCYLWMICGPGGRGTVGESLKGRVGKPGQDVSEVIAYGDVEAATAFDHGDDSGYWRSGLLAPDMDPVASANCDGPHRILGGVGAQFQFRKIEEADQPFPDAQRVGTALAGSALGQHRLAHLLDVSADPDEQRRSLLVAQSMAGGMVHVFVACLGIRHQALVDDPVRERRSHHALLGTGFAGSLLALGHFDEVPRRFDIQPGSPATGLRRWGGSTSLTS